MKREVDWKANSIMNVESPAHGNTIEPLALSLNQHVATSNM